MIDTQLNEYVALPASGHGPGVLVLHAWWGLNDFMRQVCDRLAGAGLVALAPDLFHGAVATTVEQAEQNIQGADGEATAAQVEAALDALRRHPAVRGEQVGVIGFSFGAYYALWLADHRPQDVAAVVVFYGTGDLALRPSPARYLCHFAENDPYEPAEGVQAFEQALRSSGREATIHVYPDTGHWFFEQDRLDAFNRPAAELAWERTRAFLTEALGVRDREPASG